MAKPKTLEQLRADKERAETQLAQEQQDVEKNPDAAGHGAAAAAGLGVVFIPAAQAEVDVETHDVQTLLRCKGGNPLLVIFYYPTNQYAPSSKRKTGGKLHRSKASKDGILEKGPTGSLFSAIAAYSNTFLMVSTACGRDKIPAAM